MKTKHIFLNFLLIAICCCWSCTENSNENTEIEISMNQASSFEKPKAKKVKKELTIHGDTRIDNYYWLNQREDPEVINYLTQENDYTDKVMQPTKEFQQMLFDEIVGRIKKDDTSVPYLKNGFYYQTRYEEEKEYPIYIRRKGSLEANEEVLLDANEEAKPYDFYNASGLSVSPNNRIMAYGEDTLSRRIYTIRFKNLASGEMLDDIIPNTTGRAVWANNNQTVFYSVKDDALRSYKIFKHKIGTDATEDKEVYHESDETFSCYVYKTKSEKYIVIGSYQTLSSEYRIVNADQPDEDFKVFQPRERKLEYEIEHYKDKFYIRTNLNAKNFCLMETPESATEKSNWQVYIPHREDILLEEIEIFDNFMVLAERKAGITQIRVKPWQGEDYYIDFGEDGYLAYISSNYEFDTDVVRLGYQSMTTPNSVYDYNMKTKEKTLLKQTEVLGNFSADNYRSERIFIKAKDGVEVPVSIVYHKEVKKNGEAPLLLYGYGSYGASMEPYFSSTRLSLLDRGFVYAIAHIRGGEEMGRHWYEDGKLLKKKNTFTDFIDVANYLAEAGYGNPGHLYAMGGSAGGLLMGAVVNMAPNRFNGIVAAVPFVDVITTMLDESIPLTTGEFDEWGNPKDKKYYDYIKSYSPYDNIEAKEYPNMMITTGLHDSQVQYWEPAKWIAKLREMKTDDNILLLHTNMEAGHGGASGRFRRHKETAMEYAFLLDLAGKNETFKQ